MSRKGGASIGAGRRSAVAPRAGFELIHTYTPGADVPCRIDLSDNTNRWGVAPCVAASLRNLDPLTLTRYPSLYGDRLKSAIAARLGIDASNVVTGAGSDGVLEPAIRAFAQPGGRMVLADPTFVMAAPFGRMNGLTPVPVPLLDSYDIDSAAMVASDGCVTYLCAPNNPTGTGISRTSLEEVVAGAPGLVIIDEAYAEFAAGDAIALALESERVLVVRTFSKAFGLAGLRVGYGIGAPALVQAVEKARGPYTVNAVAERAALAVLEQDDGWVADRVRDAIAARTWLAQELRALGLQPAPSEANFVFVPVDGAPEIAAHMAADGIRVRVIERLPVLAPAGRAHGAAATATTPPTPASALRITVGPDHEMRAAIDSLRAVLQRGTP